ncbi:ATP-binding protein [Bacillus wiedmannii]|uniref:ATP-binding protein n=1 Tax=Bacillus wiedmannii TaxID=1890302 RepID=UPI003D04B84E
MGIEMLKVEVTNDHLAKLLNTKPIKALEELIWNSLDADAKKVELIIEKNDLGGMESIIIIDDGQGINDSHVKTSFGNLGGSEKAKLRFSPQGRKYHGKQGEGRYRAFVLGEKVEWRSVSKKGNRYLEFNINGDLDQLKIFSLSESVESFGSNTGVSVKITELTNECNKGLPDSYGIYKELSQTFAPYLLAYKDIEIIIDNYKIDPEDIIENTNDYQICEITEEGGIVKGNLRVIEWKNGNSKNLYFCGEDGNTYDEEPSTIRAGVFPHTAYLSSKILDKLHEEDRLSVRELDETFLLLKESSIKQLKEIYRGKLAEEASEEIKKIKKEKIYPYQGQAINEVEKATRQVFDIFAYKINEVLPEFSRINKNSKQITYRLLREALETNPSSLRTILSEVLNLSIEQQDELANILEKTSLESIINTTNLITNRISFLHGLEEILFGENYQKRVKERSQLHKILLNELWLFGEHFTYSYDDISLKNVLKQHIKHLGRSDLIEEIDFSKIKGLDDIPDIGLARQYPIGEPGYYENLVIELKRPSCIISEKELSQIERYAYAIEENKHFDKNKTKWKLILLGTKFDSFTKKKVNQQGRAPGLLYESSAVNLEVWVKEWNQVIQEAKGQYQHLKKKLELNVTSNEQGLNYLKQKYKEYLPE